MEVTLEAVDAAKVPPPALAEFGKRDFDQKTKSELSDLEAQIAAQLTGQQAAPPAQPFYDPTFGQPAPASTAAPAAQTPAPAQATPVPDKFAKPDGSLDEQKLQQSYVNLEAYLEKEREMTRLRTQQAAPPAVPQYQPYQPQYQQQTPWVDPVAQKINEDMRNNPGETVLNIARAAVMQAQAQSDAQTVELRRRLELMELGQKDPSVFTLEGLNRLAQVRKENPWLDASPNPWLSAYKMAGPIAARSPQPNPQTRTAAPIVPGGQSAASIPAGPQTFSTERDLRQALEAKFPRDPFKQMKALEDIIARGNPRG